MKIDRNIPIPPRRRGGRRALYPFAEMGIGDSFHAPGAAASVEAAASQFGRRHGRKFTVRYLDGGTRIWRIA